MTEPAPLTEKQRLFLKVYAESSSVDKAAQAVDVAAQVHWEWLKETAYRAAFDVAKGILLARWEATAHQRALEGVRRMKFYAGKPIVDPETDKPYVELEYNDTLLISLLKNAWPANERSHHDPSEPSRGPVELVVREEIVDVPVPNVANEEHQPERE